MYLLEILAAHSSQIAKDEESRKILPADTEKGCSCFGRIAFCYAVLPPLDQISLL